MKSPEINLCTSDQFIYDKEKKNMQWRQEFLHQVIMGKLDSSLQTDSLKHFLASHTKCHYTIRQENNPHWSKCSTWVQSEKWQNILCSFPRQTIQYQINPDLCPNYKCWRIWCWMVLWWPTRHSGNNYKKDILYIIGDWNANQKVKRHWD